MSDFLKSIGFTICGRGVAVAAVVGVAAVGATYYFAPGFVYRQLIAAQMSASKVTLKSKEVGDWQWSYYERGASENSKSISNQTRQTIVLIHGFSDQKTTWLQFIKFLSKTYHVIAPDLPGHGDTLPHDTSKSYSIAEQVSRLNGFLCSILGENSQFHIVGHSMGGCIAGIYATTHPRAIQTVAFVSPAGVNSPNPSKFFRDIHAGERNWLLSQTSSELQFTVDFTHHTAPHIPSRILTYLSDERALKFDVSEKIFLDVKEDLMHLLGEHLPKIHQDTFIVWGLNDQVLDVSGLEIFRDSLPGKPMVSVIKDCGHMVPTEATKQFASAYLRFLRHADYTSG